MMCFFTSQRWRCLDQRGVPEIHHAHRSLFPDDRYQSQNKKVGTINGLLAACQGQEAKFIIRSLEGKLRIGLAEQTVLGSLAAAIVAAQHAKSGKNLSKEKVVRDLEEGSKIVKSVFSECPSYDKVIPPLLEGGPRLLAETIKLTPGRSERAIFGINIATTARRPSSHSLAYQVFL